jgi:nicotinamidase-related amidase
MRIMNYPSDRTALLIVGPYNDFMSEGGKLYDAIKQTAGACGMFENLRKLIPATRDAGMQVFIIPHHHPSSPPAPWRLRWLAAHDPLPTSRGARESV